MTRTAVQHAATVARMETIRENDDIIDAVQWVSTLDSRTSDECMGLDGQIFKLNKPHPEPPAHPNCRSTLVPVLHSDFANLGEGATRIAKGPDGTEIVPANQTYYEWLKTQPAEFVESAIGPTRAKLLLDGELSAKRFRELSMDRNFIPRTLDEMRKLEPMAFERIEGGIPSTSRNETITSPYIERLPREIHEEAKRINPMLDEYCNRESKWKGVVVVDNNRLGLFEGGKKHPDCYILARSNITEQEIQHELLHARSSSYYSVGEYKQNKIMEEGAVELLNQIICNEKGMTYISGGYNNLVNGLKRINRDLNLYDSDLDFAKDLFVQSMPNRYEWLEKNVSNAISMKIAEGADIRTSRIIRLRSIIDYFRP